MKFIISILSVILLVGCTATPLRDLYHVGDGWVVAAHDAKHNIFVHARQYDTTPVAIYPKQTIVVNVNDTISSIAKSYYGDLSLWSDIAKVNDIPSPYIIFAGDRLNLPEHRIYNPDPTLKNIVELDMWELRIVNSGTNGVCVKLNLLTMDYTSTVSEKWLPSPTFNTTYIGRVVQDTWQYENGTVMTLHDAKWAVNTLTASPMVSSIDDTNKPDCTFLNTSTN